MNWKHLEACQIKMGQRLTKKLARAAYLLNEKKKNWTEPMMKGVCSRLANV